MDLRETPKAGRRHPWESSRLDFFVRLLRSHELLSSSTRVLDAGAGDGWFARQLVEVLPPEARVTCWDPGYGERPPGPNEGRVEFTAVRPRGSFDLVLALDVLEHVEDDQGFLQSLVADCLRPGGHLLVSVPAWNILYSTHDRKLGHRRRYSPAGCEELLAAAGLRVLRKGGLFYSLFWVRGAWKLLSRSGWVRGPSGADGWAGGARLTSFVESVLRLDGGLSLLLSRAGLSLPGLSFFALCRKR